MPKSGKLFLLIFLLVFLMPSPCLHSPLVPMALAADMIQPVAKKQNSSEGEDPLAEGFIDEDGFKDIDPFLSPKEGTDKGDAWLDNAIDTVLEDTVLDNTILEDNSDGISLPDATASNFYLGGYAELETEIGYEKPNEESDEKLSKFKPILFVETEYRFNRDHKFRASGLASYDAAYGMTAKDQPGAQSLDDEISDVELRDLYLDSTLGDVFSVKAGRQIIAWGDSNYARITDVINPRDNTSPGLIELEDSRLPVAALRLSAQYGSLCLDGVSIHEHPGSKISGLGADFDYYAPLRQPNIWIRDKNTPDTGFKDTGFAFKATRSFNGGDISLVASNTFDDLPILSYQGITPAGILVFTPEYERFSTMGISASMTKKSALFKVEAAFRKDRPVQRNDVLFQIAAGIPAGSIQTFDKKDQVEALTGLEYTGISDLRILLEGKLLHTLDHESFLGMPEYEYRTYFQATYEMLNETLALDLFWVYFNPGQGHILRLSGEYDIFDDLSVQLGMAFYDADNSDTVIYPYRDMDRIFFRFKYFF